MNTDKIYIGIDVAKKKHDICIMNQALTILKKKFTFDNTLLGYQSLLTLVSTLGSKQSIYFGMEVTGNYGLNLYHRLKNDGFIVIMIRPDIVTKYRAFKGLPKSDKIDATLIAEIQARGEAKEAWVSQKGYTKLKQLVHRRAQFNKMLSQEKVRLISHIDVIFPDIQYLFASSSSTMYAVLMAYPTPYSIIHAGFDELNDLIYQTSKHRLAADKTLELIEAAKNSIAIEQDIDDSRLFIASYIDHIKRLKEQVAGFDKLIDMEARNFPHYTTLLSLTGCGNYTAAVVISELGDIHRFQTGSQIVSFSGLYGNNKLSGDSVCTNGKMSKKGSRLLRHAIYMIAECARRSNPIFKEFFIKKKSGKRNRHLLAVNALANKLCHVIFSIMKKTSPYILYHKDILKLPELTRTEFFQNIEIDFSKTSRRKSYLLEDEHGEIHKFIYLKTKVPSLTT